MSLVTWIKLPERQTKVLIFAWALVFPALVFAGGASSAGDSEKPPCDFRRLAPYHRESVRIKNEFLYAGQPYIAHVYNKPFVDRMYRLTEGLLYLHVENAILKVLNDKAFMDKEVSAATLNRFKTIFFEQLQRSRAGDYLLGIEQGGRYNDYKSVRLIFDTQKAGVEWLVKELEQLHQKVNSEFAASMRDFPELARAYAESNNPRLGNPGLWHEMGLAADSPHKASMKARLRRNDRGSQLLFGSQDEARIAEDLAEAEMFRTMLVSQLGTTPLFRDGLPSEALVDVLRFAQTAPELRTQQDYIEYVKLALERRFGVDVDPTEILRLQRYYFYANELAPSVVTPFQEPIELADLSKADHGVWAWDISGQNMRNMTGVFESIHLAHSAALNKNFNSARLVETTLEETANRQLRESEKFWKFRSLLQDTLVQHQIIPPKEASRLQSVGDESTALPYRSPKPVQIGKVLTDLAQNPEYGGLFRSTLQNQSYADGSPIPRAERFELISRGENLEKALRKNLEGSPAMGLFPYDQLREVMISIRIDPVSAQQARIHIDVARSGRFPGPERLSDVIRAMRKILDKQTPSGWTVERITPVEKLLDEVTDAAAVNTGP